MWITKDFWIAKKRNGDVWSNISGKEENFSTEPFRSVILNLLRAYRSKYVSDIERLKLLQDVRNTLAGRNGETLSPEDEYEKERKLAENKKKLEDACRNLINFFSEFSFTPNFRFVNTLSKHLTISKNCAINYIVNYFKLTDNSYTNQIIDKIQSQEFAYTLEGLQTVLPTKTINNRFRLYYGAQGTGKTTEAMQEANNNCMVCHSAMLPSDLMEDFAFDDGKATFQPSQLYKAMVEGKKIVLDEINLLPFESLRFLQSILDGKESFVYKGQTVQIAEGFEIIGTMNLQVNGCTYALPEPLVDRASCLKEFVLTAEQLVGAIL